MKAAAKYIVVVGLGTWLALFASSSVAVAQLTGGAVSAWAGQVSPMPVASGQPAESILGAQVDAAPGAPPYCTLNAPTWSWSVDGGTPGVNIVQPDPSSPTATLTATFMSPGTYTVSATVTATWEDSCGDKTSATADTGPFTITVVGINNLQYLQPGQYTSTFVDVPGTLYVLVGSTVTFQAVPTPDGSSFPDGWPIWSGTSGASGTGSVIGVTFTTPSSSLTDYKIVTAICGNSPATANVIVYDLIPTLTPEDNFAGRDLDNYGVCEYIDLNFQTNPPGITASLIGGLQWQQTSGSGTLVDNGDGTGEYQCAEVADTVNLTLVVGWLFVPRSAPPKGVVPPDSHDCTQVPNTGLWHQQNNCGCKAQVYQWAKCAKAVSFNQIQVREGQSSPAVANGLFAASNGQVHTPSAGWFGLEARTDSGYKWANAVDTTGFAAGGAPFQAGTFQWNISMMYRKRGKADDGMEYAGCQVNKSSDANGLATISKGSFGPVSIAAACGSDLNFSLPQPP